VATIVTPRSCWSDVCGASLHDSDTTTPSLTVGPGTLARMATRMEKPLAKDVSQPSSLPVSEPSLLLRAQPQRVRSEHNGRRSSTHAVCADSPELDAKQHATGMARAARGPANGAQTKAAGRCT
jgi:hypothetical protein